MIVGNYNMEYNIFIIDDDCGLYMWSYNMRS